MPNQDNTRISFIGLGNMGRGMCRNLVGKYLWTTQRVNKLPLVVYNRIRSRAEESQAEMPEDSVIIAQSIKEAAINNSPAGKLFVESSTIHPLKTQAICNQILRADARFVACPVFGAPDRADQGQLVGLAAGPGLDVQRVKPWFDGVIGRAVIDLGDRPAHLATTLKVIGNSLISNMVEAVAEGHLLAEKTDLGGNALHEYLSLFFPGVYAAYSSRIMQGDYWRRAEPLFAAQLARKDAGHAMDLAHTVGTGLPALEVADAHLAAVVGQKGDRGDYVGIYGVLRGDAALPYEN